MICKCFDADRLDIGARSLTAEHITASVAGKNRDESLGNGMIKLLTPDARPIADNLDSNNPVKMLSKTSSSLAPTGHEVSPVEIDSVPIEDAMLSDCDVSVAFEMNEIDRFPVQVSHPLVLETHCTSALRLTEDAIARIASYATDLSTEPFHPILISRADVIVESVEIKVFRLDRAEELLN